MGEGDADNYHIINAKYRVILCRSKAFGPGYTTPYYLEGGHLFWMSSF